MKKKYSGAVLVAVCLSILMAAEFTRAETESIASMLSDRGYVSVPSRFPGTDRRMQIDAKLHGHPFVVWIDLSNQRSRFDIRTLRKLDIKTQSTELNIQTPTMLIDIYTANIVGLEFGTASSKAIQVHAGDIDRVYGIPSGQEGPDAVMGTDFFKTYGGLLDFERGAVHLKLR